MNDEQLGLDFEELEEENSFELYSQEFHELPVIDEIEEFELRDIYAYDESKQYNLSSSSDIRDEFEDNLDYCRNDPEVLEACISNSYVFNYFLAKAEMVEKIRYGIAYEEDEDLSDEELLLKYKKYTTRMMLENFRLLRALFSSYACNYNSDFTESLFISYLVLHLKQIDIKEWEQLLQLSKAIK